MADGMMHAPEAAPPFCETHRAMLQIAGRSLLGNMVPREVLASAIIAARLHTPDFAATTLRNKMMAGRASVYVWPIEVDALLRALPPPAAAPRRPIADIVAAAREAMKARAMECFDLADALAGPDLTMQHRAHRIGERMLADFLALAEALEPTDEPANAEIIERAMRLFGDKPAGSAALCAEVAA